ncbi:hypothetical protein MTO96_032309 [Rhipicephalus appendiculatus]
MIAAEDLNAARYHVSRQVSGPCRDAGGKRGYQRRTQGGASSRSVYSVMDYFIAVVLENPRPPYYYSPNTKQEPDESCTCYSLY